MSDQVRLGKSVQLLLIEDTPSDVRLMREALRETHFHLDLTVVADGVRAIQVLNEMKISHSLPDLIVLDLNLPKKNGREVLAEVKSDPILKHIPVLVMTSSHDEEDVAAVYALNANCYIRKPMNLPEYERVIHAIEDFWFMTVTLPEGDTTPGLSPKSGATPLPPAVPGNIPIQ